MIVIQLDLKYQEGFGDTVVTYSQDLLSLDDKSGPKSIFTIRFAFSMRSKDQYSKNLKQQPIIPIKSKSSHYESHQDSKNPLKF